MGNAARFLARIPPDTNLKYEIDTTSRRAKTDKKDAIKLANYALDHNRWLKNPFQCLTIVSRSCLWFTLPAAGRVRDFHPGERALARRTKKQDRPGRDGPA